MKHLILTVSSFVALLIASNVVATGHASDMRSAAVSAPATTVVDDDTRIDDTIVVHAKATGASDDTRIDDTIVVHAKATGASDDTRIDDAIVVHAKAIAAR